MEESDRLVDGRRVRAALAYADIPALEVWSRLKGSKQRTTTTLDRWKKYGIPTTQPKSTANQLAEVCGLPAAFFYADFSRLAEIVPVEDADALALTDRGPDPAGTAAARRVAEDRAGQHDEERRQGPQDRRTDSSAGRSSAPPSP
jgi:hypothetical protein